MREKKSRAKQTIPEQMPKKKWLSLTEGSSYLSMSPNHFLEIVLENELTVSVIRRRKYFNVDQLNSLFEKHVIIKHQSGN